MKVAVVGAGKTGSAVIDLLVDEVIGPFNSKNKVSYDELVKADVAIVFTPGEVFLEVFPHLIEAKIPVVTGATGFEWNKDMLNAIEGSGVPWVSATNFSLGMNIVKVALNQMSRLKDLMGDVQAHITETHHTKKLDAPSGTAKSWASWFGYSGDIESIREGDVKGIHELTLTSPFEKITLKHESLDRALFAQGAIWAAKYIMQNQLEAKLYLFEEIIEQKYQEGV
jgi:4-hydroxy-tetrahydrodipicolinate reductase